MEIISKDFCLTNLIEPYKEIYTIPFLTESFCESVIKLCDDLHKYPTLDELNIKSKKIYINHNKLFMSSGNFDGLNIQKIVK